MKLNMKPFRWTAPEPTHRDPRIMSAAEFAYWTRVRARGIEWFVVSKGLLLFLSVPALAQWLLAIRLGPATLTLGWSSGLLAGLALWSRRERRYAESIEARVDETSQSV